MNPNNFLGIPIMSVTEIQAKIASQEQHIYLVIRVADFDHEFAPNRLQARSIKLPCDHCRKLCYADPVAFNPLRGMNLIVTCNRCMTTQLQEQEDQG